MFKSGIKKIYQARVIFTLCGIQPCLGSFNVHGSSVGGQVVSLNDVNFSIVIVYSFLVKSLLSVLAGFFLCIGLQLRFAILCWS